MPFVPVPNTVQINTVYELDSQEVETTSYYKKATAVTTSDLTSLLEEVNTIVRTQLIPFLGNTITLVRLVGTLLSTVDGLIAVSTTSLPVSGGASGEAAPNNVALTMSIRTAARGRSFRGRNYIPGIPKDLITESEVGSGSVAAYTDAYTALMGAGADLGFEMVVVSRFSGFTIVGGRKVPTPRAEGIATPVTNVFVVDNTVDSQRRRLPGRGR